MSAARPADIENGPPQSSGTRHAAFMWINGQAAEQHSSKYRLPHFSTLPMNAYQEARTIEDVARRELLPWLLKTCQSVEDTAHSEFLQKTCGDWIITKLSQQYGVELKAESKYTGNLFLETWSNLPRRTLGWMYTSQADWLFYYFADTKELFVIDFPALWMWAFGVGEKDGAIYKYAEKTQNRYNQINLTRGRVVPIVDIQAARIPVKKYSAGQRGAQVSRHREEFDGIKF